MRKWCRELMHSCLRLESSCSNFEAYSKQHLHIDFKIPNPYVHRCHQASAEQGKKLHIFAELDNPNKQDVYDLVPATSVRRTEKTIGSRYKYVFKRKKLTVDPRPDWSSKGMCKNQASKTAKFLLAQASHRLKVTTSTHFTTRE